MVTIIREMRSQSFNARIGVLLVLRMRLLSWGIVEMETSGKPSLDSSLQTDPHVVAFSIATH